MLSVDILASPQLLHIPDGFLSTAVSLLCWLIALAALSLAVRRAQADYDERLVPLAGVLAAFIFAAQMINFPVAGGTSGHLIGAALAFIVLGPWLGLLVMTAVIGLQALLFQDGGLFVMGANILVMGAAPGFVAYGLFQLAAGYGRTVRLAAAAVGAWLSVVVGAFVTAVLLGFSGTASLAVVLPLMVGVHMLIGVGEGLITVAALSFILRSRPQLFGAQPAGHGGRWLLAGVGIVLLVLLLSPYASTSPDGLEWVAQQQAFMDTAVSTPYQILPDYAIPGWEQADLSTIIAGLVGVLAVAAVVVVVGRALARHKAGS